jgi:ABC-type antimicrobial peptide transport system permease subunit
LSLVLGQGLVLALAGVAVGLAGAFALTRAMRSLLFGVGAADPVTFLGVPVLLVVAAIGASLLPARRAAAIDPAISLRSE